MGVLNLPLASGSAPAGHTHRLRTFAAHAGHACGLPRGTVILRQEQPARHVFLLISGHALLTRVESSGNDVAITWTGPDSFLGLAAVLQRAAHSTSATLRADAEVLMVPGERLLDAMQTPELAAAVAGHLADEQTRLLERYAGRLGLSLRARVLAAMSETVLAHVPRSRQVPLSTYELACLVGADVSSVCRVLRALRSEGSIEFRRGTITIGPRMLAIWPAPA